MDDLAAFLTARLDEDEAEANAQMAGVCPSCGCWGVPHACTGIRVVNTNALHPTRVLREVAAKRAILEDCAPLADYGARQARTLAWTMLAHLAAVYSDHPGYRDEWR